MNPSFRPPQLPDQPQQGGPSLPFSIGTTDCERWLSEALAPSIMRNGVRIVGVTAEEMGAGTGFTGWVFRLRISYDRPCAGAPGTAVLKLASPSHAAREIMERLGAYRREVAFYQRIRSDRGLQPPRCYFAGPFVDGAPALLLEDLSALRAGDNLEGCSETEAGRVLESLARFHARWWERDEQRVTDAIPTLAKDGPGWEEVYARLWRVFRRRSRGGLPKPLEEAGEALLGRVAGVTERLSLEPLTLVHGDFRLDNLFFPREDGGPLRAIDWQMAARGRGPADAGYFAAWCLTPQQRRESELALLRRYHAALLHEGVDRYPFEACLEDYRLGMLQALLRLVLGAVALPASGPRGRALAAVLLERTAAALQDHGSAEILRAVPRA